MDKALQGFVRVSMNPKEAFAPLPHIPIQMVEERAAWHRGVSHEREQGPCASGYRTRPRFKELGDLTKFRMPKASFEKPYRLL